MFGEDGRRKRPEALAAFDFGVEQFFGILATGISDDAPCAERSRPKLSASAEPSDDVAIH